MSKENNIQQEKKTPNIEDLGEGSTNKATHKVDSQKDDIAEDVAHRGNQEAINMDNIQQVTKEANLSPKHTNLLKGNNSKIKEGNKADQSASNLRALLRRLAASKSNQ